MTYGTSKENLIHIKLNLLEN